MVAHRTGITNNRTSEELTGRHRNRAEDHESRRRLVEVLERPV